MKMEYSTTIQLQIETRDELKKLGVKGETYDEIINRLINAYRNENGINKGSIQVAVEEALELWIKEKQDEKRGEK